ncbi:hypothetical protein ES708_34274 [subsurface metagenome]
MAQSRTKGNSSSEGIPKVKGLVPNIFSTPKVGAMEGRALVPLIPIIPASIAIKT